MSRQEQLGEKSFEELAELLEQTLRKLEGDGLTLEESITEYEKAVDIAAIATERLETATLRVTEISARLDTKRATKQEADNSDNDWETVEL